MYWKKYTVLEELLLLKKISRGQPSTNSKYLFFKKSVSLKKNTAMLSNHPPFSLTFKKNQTKKAVFYIIKKDFLREKSYSNKDERINFVAETKMFVIVRFTCLTLEQVVLTLGF